VVTFTFVEATWSRWADQASHNAVCCCLLCQVSGRQRLLLVPPEQGFKGCYPFPVAHPYDRYSCVDWEEPELQHWPAAAQVCSREQAAVVHGEPCVTNYFH
jgi:hypothetical protein